MDVQTTKVWNFALLGVGLNASTTQPFRGVVAKGKLATMLVLIGPFTKKPPPVATVPVGHVASPVPTLPGATMAGAVKLSCEFKLTPTLKGFRHHVYERPAFRQGP